MKKEVIINKLIEKGIIKSENDIDKDLEVFISLGIEYDIDEILQSDLLEKYGAKIISECIKLRPRAKLSDTRFRNGMSIEDMEVYCKIKQANPELDIVKNDKFLHSINKDYIAKYGAKDLGFIIEKIDILSNYTHRDENGNKIGSRGGNFFYNSNERDNPSVDNAFRYNITQNQLKKLKRIVEQYPNFKFEIIDELSELEEFWNLDDETFKNILTGGKYYYENKFQQICLKEIIINGKLDKWLEIKKENDFLPKDYIFLDGEIVKQFSLDELRILSTNDSNWWNEITIRKSIEYGTLKNIVSYIKDEISRYEESEHFSRSKFSINIKKPENCTDENIELFGGIENIEKFGNEILENEEYLKNYKYIKENYGQMSFLDINVIQVLSDENVRKIGYENIFKFFNNEGYGHWEKFKNIPETITKEELDKVIEVYGEIPLYKGFYNEKIIKEIKKAREEKKEINFENEWIQESSLSYILENGLEENIVTILNTNIDMFTVKDYYGRKELQYNRLKLMTPKILEELGIENTARIANLGNFEIILEAQQKDLLNKWKSKIDSAKEEEKDIIFSIGSVLLLDEKNDDLSIDEIKRINYVLGLEEEYKNEVEEIIKENPEYIRLLEIPNILFDGIINGYFKIYRIKENLEDISSKYREFEEIKNIIGNENFIKLINSEDMQGSERLYNKMQQSYQNHTLENWKKLLEIDDTFIPIEVEFLDGTLFIRNSAEDIMDLNKQGYTDRLKDLIKDYPKCLLAIYNIKELLELDKRVLLSAKNAIDNEKLDKEIISLMQDKNVSNNLKQYIKEVLLV